jgi:hypothetical protein
MEIDYMMHMWFGTYGLSAVSVAVEHCLAGRKAKSKYIEKPVLPEMQKKNDMNRELTEDEKQAQLDKFVMSLKIMESNFNAEHENKTERT